MAVALRQSFLIVICVAVLAPIAFFVGLLSLGFIVALGVVSLGKLASPKQRGSPILGGPMPSRSTGSAARPFCCSCRTDLGDPGITFLLAVDGAWAAMITAALHHRLVLRHVGT